MVVQLQDSRLLGRWRHRRGAVGAPEEYRIGRTNGGELRFDAADGWTNGAVSGILHLKGLMLEAHLSCGDGTNAGSVRMIFIEDEDAMISNFRSSSSSKWSGDLVASKVADDLAKPRKAAQSAVRPDVRKDHRYLGSRVIGELPHLIDVPHQALPLIATFAKDRKGTSDLVKITGGRYEVFLQGVGSEPFQRFASKSGDGKVILNFLQELRVRLEEVAHMNGGMLSDDIVALVGGSEMQVPHVDLKPGQVQVLVALHTTAPTLVFDPEAERPSKQQVVEALSISDQVSEAPHLFPLFSGGSPLALPVAKLYDNMVPACKAFDAGDAVQIRDGVVHAGPKWDREGTPRIVVFSTYSPHTVKHYDVNFQYKIWDWASFAEVPPLVAYDRLFEVHTFAQARGMSVLPWTFYEGDSQKACKTLCTTAGLDGESIEWLVQQWRSQGKQPAQFGWVK